MKKCEVDYLIIGTAPHFLGSKNYGGVADVVWNLANELDRKGKET